MKTCALNQHQDPTSRSKHLRARTKAAGLPSSRLLAGGAGCPPFGKAQHSSGEREEFVSAKAVQCKSRRWGDSSPAPG